MQVLISTYGSRGDVQPMVGLVVALQALGADVRLCAPPDQEFRELLARAGVPLAPAFAPVRQWIEMAKQLRLGLPRLAAKMVPAQFDAIAAAAEGCDVIVATGLFPSVAAAQSVAEKLGIPFVWTAFCPLIVPSPHHPPMEYPGHPHPPGVIDNRALWAFNARAMNALFGEAVNTHRASIGLPTADDVRDYVFTDRPWLASDPILSPWPPTDCLEVVQTGAWTLPDARSLAVELEAFLEAGSPPVYVGFGSMAMQAAPDAARAVIEAVRAQDPARSWPAAGRSSLRSTIRTIASSSTRSTSRCCSPGRCRRASWRRGHDHGGCPGGRASAGRAASGGPALLGRPCRRPWHRRGA
jgi:vancomycin aglycone glucosyltransferase